MEVEDGALRRFSGKPVPLSSVRISSLAHRLASGQPRHRCALSLREHVLSIMKHAR